MFLMQKDNIFTLYITYTNTGQIWSFPYLALVLGGLSDIPKGVNAWQ